MSSWSDVLAVILFDQFSTKNTEKEREGLWHGVCVCVCVVLCVLAGVYGGGGGGVSVCVCKNMCVSVCAHTYVCAVGC